MDRQQAIDTAVRKEGMLLNWCRHMKQVYRVDPSMIDVVGWPQWVKSIRAEFAALE